MNILLVKSGTKNSRCIEKKLEEIGDKPVLAPSPSRALEILKEISQTSAAEAFELLIMEPGEGQEHQVLLDYLETVKKNTPMLLILEKNQIETVRNLHDNSLKSAPVDFMTKPINTDELQARISLILHLRDEIEKRQRSEAELLAVNRQLKEANRILRRLSAMDGLTRVDNRRSFDKFIEKEWRRMMRGKKPLSLIICDIDFFKAFNDKYGHAEGDESLKRVAKTLYDLVKRPGDLVSRFGGDEFSILLPDTDGDNALRLAEKARGEIEVLKIPNVLSNVSDHMTISLGVSTIIPSNKATPYTLIKAADRALVLAKGKGKNTVCSSG